MAALRRAGAATAHKRLLTEARALMRDAPPGVFAAPVSDENLLEWRALIAGPDETPYEGGVYEARLKFPADYPFSPPTMHFVTPMWHPNVYAADGEVCISILHAGADPLQYETEAERWCPSQSISAVLLSVMSMLAEPNVESGANIDASKMWRDDRAAYDARVERTVRASLGLDDGRQQ
mmetsp:Transcript_32649/g.79934  ORF Transcript_32649/g.79934 Transcript_32649/m.79934 type:complete len:179 (+) Transcript_32649:78-614(+)